MTTLLTTFWACYSSLKEAPSRLILPKAPKSGKRILLEKITPLWSRLSFIHKVTARNLFRYKKRFLMTVVGIAGCTALLLTGFGLQDSISDIVNLQFGEVLQYNPVSYTHLEAAKVLGFNKKQTFFRIILPQVVKRIIPPMGNEFITLVKDTSLAQVIAVVELLKVTNNWVSSAVSMVPFVIAAVFYLVMNGVVTRCFTIAEKRLSYYR